MNCETDPSNSDPQSNPRANPRHTRFLLKAIWIVVGATLLIVALFLSIGHTRLSETGLELVVAFIYSAVIALPSIFLVTRISVRFATPYPHLVVLMQALVLLCTSVAGCLAAGLVLQVIGLFPPHAYWREFRSSAPFSVVITLAFGLSMATFETMRYKLQATVLELRTRQVEQERAYKLLAEARLSSLESRIHPHFLFNTLNSIAALIPSDPQRAEDTVGKLASLLRFSLNARQTGLVPLNQELKVVRDYLEIESTRFGPRLRYEIEVPDSLASVRVPPLALQSLVENSVKHVVSQRTQGATIQVFGEESSGLVRLQVIDDGPGFSLDAITPEHGIGNLVARLELLFGSAARLEVERLGDKTAVRLSFPV